MISWKLGSLKKKVALSVLVVVTCENSELVNLQSLSGMSVFVSVT